MLPRAPRTLKSLTLRSDEPQRSQLVGESRELGILEESEMPGFADSPYAINELAYRHTGYSTDRFRHERKRRIPSRGVRGPSMQRSRPKSDYAGQISPRPQGGRKQSLKPLGRKNGFSEQTTAKFVRPERHIRHVGFAACRTTTRRNRKDRRWHSRRERSHRS